MHRFQINSPLGYVDEVFTETFDVFYLSWYQNVPMLSRHTIQAISLLYRVSVIVYFMYDLDYKRLYRDLKHTLYEQKYKDTQEGQ